MNEWTSSWPKAVSVASSSPDSGTRIVADVLLEFFVFVLLFQKLAYLCSLILFNGSFFSAAGNSDSDGM